MIILASQSVSRRAMLDAAGVLYEARPANLDERAIEQRIDTQAPGDIALALAEAKARAVCAITPDRLVLGSDSLITVENKRFDKPKTRDEAANHLRFFSGRIMELHSSAALARNGQIIWRHSAHAHLHVRELSDDFISAYLAEEWPAVSGCVGVFRMEGRGVQLFSQITGDYFTILGMPLLPVLEALREAGELQK